jgi:hypothetical protein
MKTIKIVPIPGDSAHDLAEAQRRLEGWKIISVFEERGRHYAIVENSK